MIAIKEAIAHANFLLSQDDAYPDERMRQRAAVMAQIACAEASLMVAESLAILVERSQGRET